MTIVSHASGAIYQLTLIHATLLFLAIVLDGDRRRQWRPVHRSQDERNQNWTGAHVGGAPPRCVRFNQRREWSGGLQRGKRGREQQRLYHTTLSLSLTVAGLHSSLVNSPSAHPTTSTTASTHTYLISLSLSFSFSLCHSPSSHPLLSTLISLRHLHIHRILWSIKSAPSCRSPPLTTAQ